MSTDTLEQSLADIHPQPKGTYVFAQVSQVPADLDPFATIKESQGTTIIVPVEQADAAGLDCSTTFTRINLGVNSSLLAVGVVATVAQTLASRGIACNVVAAVHTDHVFVPSAQSTDALRALAGLQRQAEGWL